MVQLKSTHHILMLQNKRRTKQILNFEKMWCIQPIFNNSLQDLIVLALYQV